MSNFEKLMINSFEAWKTIGVVVTHECEASQPKTILIKVIVCEFYFVSINGIERKKSAFFPKNLYVDHPF